MQAQKWNIIFLPWPFHLSYLQLLASGSTEVKQEKKSGSAAKKPKLDPIGEPGTSEVSNTSETRKFKGKDKGKIAF